MAVKKILIIRFSSIGDIILTTPVIRCIKQQLKDSEVHFCTKESFRGLLESNPYVDKVHTLKESTSELVQDLKKEQFDFIVDLHQSLRSRLIKLKLGKPSRSFNKLNFKKWLYVNFKINRLPNVHIVDRYMDAASPLGIFNDDEGLNYFIPEKDEVESSWLPETHQKEYIAVVIGGQHTTKKLPTSKLIELCDKINKPIILLGGKEDEAEANKIESFFQPLQNKFREEEISDTLGKKAVIFNACGKFNLNQSACLVRDARVVFTHDTGLMHVAAAFKKEIFSIWGNTSPFFGMYPYQTKFTVFENNKIDCRPCSKIGYNKCPKGHFKCMNDQFFDFWIP